MSSMVARTHVVAIDIGGTKVSAAIVENNGSIIAKEKVAVERNGADVLAAQIRDLVSSLFARGGLRREDVSAAGVIVPGIYFAETGDVWVPNLWGHAKVPFRKELQDAVGVRVCMDSDRAGYVLGEQWLGAARGAKDVVFLSVGTGIGAGIISGGRLLRGAGDIAGAVGWFALTPEYRDVYAQVGCWEAEAAGPGLARRGQADTAEQVIAAARAGNSAATQAIDEAARYLGMGIANLVSLFNPEMIVLGGGLMQSHDLFIEEIRNGVLRWAQPEAARQVRIVPGELGENAGLLGAARIAFDNARTES